MRRIILILFAILTHAGPVAAQAANTERGWGMMALGAEITAWRVGNHGTELGGLAAIKQVGASASDRISTYSTQILALGGGEGGFQAEYDNRIAYGLRAIPLGEGALVARVGGDINALITPHGSTLTLGPLVDLGYQAVTRRGYLDIGWQGIFTLLPALYSDNSSKHAFEWFSTGPHLGARVWSLVFDGYAARTMDDGRMRNEFHADVCGVTSFIICTRVHEYKFDDLHEHVTLIGLFFGLGGTLRTKQK